MVLGSENSYIFLFFHCWEAMQGTPKTLCRCLKWDLDGILDSLYKNFVPHPSCFTLSNLQAQVYVLSILKVHVQNPLPNRAEPMS